MKDISMEKVIEFMKEHYDIKDNDLTELQSGLEQLAGNSGNPEEPKEEPQPTEQETTEEPKAEEKPVEAKPIEPKPQVEAKPVEQVEQGVDKIKVLEERLAKLEGKLEVASDPADTAKKAEPIVNPNQKENDTWADIENSWN